MERPKTFPQIERAGEDRDIPRVKFLKRMEQIVPWAPLIRELSPCYSRHDNGRSQIGLERMLRIYFVGDWYRLTSAETEEALHDSQALRDFAQIGPGSGLVPDTQTITDFREFMQYDQMPVVLRDKVNAALTDRGWLMKRGTLIEAELAAVPPVVAGQPLSQDSETDQAVNNEQPVAEAPSEPRTDLSPPRTESAKAYSAINPVSISAIAQVQPELRTVPDAPDLPSHHATARSKAGPLKWPGWDRMAQSMRWITTKRQGYQPKSDARLPETKPAQPLTTQQTPVTQKLVSASAQLAEFHQNIVTGGPRAWLDAVGVSVTGPGHTGRGIPCQDRFKIRSGPDWLVAVVSDGAGTASRAEDGANIATYVSVEHLTAALTTRYPSASDITEGWLRDEVEVAIRKARERCLEMANAGEDLRSFHATVVGLIVLHDITAIFHIGDGAAIAYQRTTDEPRTVEYSPPENGEYIDQTFFFTEPNWKEHLRFIFVHDDFDAVWLMTDGISPQVIPHGTKRLRKITENEIHRIVFDTPAKNGIQMLEAVLTSDAARRYSDDDKTLVIVRRRA